MLLTLALVVLSAAIVVFFSQEFLDGFKKVFSVPGAKLFLPLLLISWLVYTFDYWVFGALLTMKTQLDLGQSYLVNIFPSSKSTQAFVQILILTAVSVLPVSVLSVYCQHKHHKPYPYPYLTSTVLWLIAMVIFVML